jgi:hypothetical protein
MDTSQTTPRQWSLKRLVCFISLLVVMTSLVAIWAEVPDTNVVHAAGASNPPPGTVVHATSCEQAPPQSAKDRATYTSAELARYGLPPQTPGEPFAKWATMVRAAGKRICDYTIGSGH